MRATMAWALSISSGIFSPASAFTLPATYSSSGSSLITVSPSPAPDDLERAGILAPVHAQPVSPAASRRPSTRRPPPRTSSAPRST